MTDTIFALATGPGVSGVAVIRISGPKADEALTLLTTPHALPTQRQACVRSIHYPLGHLQAGTPIDHALVLRFKAPHSFTGEDTVELHTHGSRAVIHTITDILSQMDGIRLAEPGEFSRRSFENGKMDLTQAEGLADLIDAQTSRQATLALRQMQGELGTLYDRWREEIIALMAMIEAYIDFPDEDLPASVAHDITVKQRTMLEDIRRHLGDANKGERLRTGFVVVIVGAPNAGKSSLMNLLAKRDVAIVSDIAGTTRDVLEVHLDLDGYPVCIIDTAGLRENTDAIEKEGIARAYAKAKLADCRIALFDASQKDPIDQSTKALIDDSTIIAFNKIDTSDDAAEHINNALLAHGDALSGKEDALSISTKTRQGIDNLIAAITARADKALALGDDPVLTRQRHRQLLTECELALSQFSLDQPPEITAEHLRQAAHSLGCITGHIDIDEVLTALFSTFCIGK